MILPKHPSREQWPERAIGYWRVIDAAARRYSTEPEIPFEPAQFVDPAWDPAERDMVISYLERKHTVKAQWRGSSRCRVCGCRNGSTCITDGVFIWPQGLSHYLRHHHVRPPVEFVEHVRSRQ